MKKQEAGIGTRKTFKKNLKSEIFPGKFCCYIEAMYGCKTLGRLDKNCEEKF